MSTEDPSIELYDEPKKQEPKEEEDDEEGKKEIAKLVKDMSLDEVWAMINIRRSGKSILASYLALLIRRLYPIVFVFTGTYNNNFWQQFVPAHYVCDGFNEARLQQVIDMQSKRFRTYKEAKSKNGKAGGNPMCLIIFDDCMKSYDESTKKQPNMRTSKAINHLLFKGRHEGIMTMFLLQDYVGLDRSQRNNIERFFFFKTTDERSIEMMKGKWGKEKVEQIKKITDEPYTAAMVDNRANKDTTITRIKAPLKELKAMMHKNLVLGNSRAWKGIDVKKQKKKYPYIELPAKNTLESRFNQKVGFAEDPIKIDGQDDPPEEEDGVGW